MPSLNQIAQTQLPIWYTWIKPLNGKGHAKNEDPNIWDNSQK